MMYELLKKILWGKKSGGVLQKSNCIISTNSM